MELLHANIKYDYSKDGDQIYADERTSNLGPLHYAFERCDLASIKWLHSKGRSFNSYVKGFGKRKPLEVASYQRCHEIAEFIESI
ncbi:MAG: hypothetical protein HOE90_03990 [Bacteriovoracaceae bacterium]|nr:hypothetical protein [Bacteriovoracaceae bacterium]